MSQRKNQELSKRCFENCRNPNGERDDSENALCGMLRGENNKQENNRISVKFRSHEQDKFQNNF